MSREDVPEPEPEPPERLVMEGEKVDLSWAEADAHMELMGREMATRKVVREDMPSK